MILICFSAIFFSLSSIILFNSRTKSTFSFLNEESTRLIIHSIESSIFAILCAELREVSIAFS